MIVNKSDTITPIAIGAPPATPARFHIVDGARNPALAGSGFSALVAMTCGCVVAVAPPCSTEQSARRFVGSEDDWTRRLISSMIQSIHDHVPAHDSFVEGQPDLDPKRQPLTQEIAGPASGSETSVAAAAPPPRANRE